MPEQPAVVVRVVVDKAGGEDQAMGIDDAVAGRGGERSHGGDLVVDDANGGRSRGRASPVDDLGIDDENLMALAGGAGQYQHGRCGNTELVHAANSTGRHASARVPSPGVSGRDRAVWARLQPRQSLPIAAP